MDLALPAEPVLSLRCVDPSRPWAGRRLVADAAGLTLTAAGSAEHVAWSDIDGIDVVCVSGMFGTRFAVVISRPGAPLRLMFPRFGLTWFDPSRTVDVAHRLRMLALEQPRGLA